MFGISMPVSLGVQALLALVVHFIFLIVTWWALQSFRFDVFLKRPDSPQAKTVMILLTIVIASLVGDFFLEYFHQSLRLKFLF